MWNTSDIGVNIVRRWHAPPVWAKPSVTSQAGQERLARVETDGSGNYVNAFSVPLIAYGKSNHQAEAVIGNAVAGVVSHTGEAGKPSSSRNWTSVRKRPHWKARTLTYDLVLNGQQPHWPVMAPANLT